MLERLIAGRTPGLLDPVPTRAFDAGGTEATFVPMSKSVLLRRNTFIEMQYSI